MSEPTSEQPKPQAGGGTVARVAMPAVLVALAGGAIAWWAIGSVSPGADGTLADAVSSTRTTVLIAFVGLTIAAAAVAAMVSRSMGRRDVVGLVPLRDAVRDSADRLPEFVQAYATGADELPDPLAVSADADGIVGDLATSFNAMQRTAAELIVTQARLRSQEFDRLIDLGRRNQELLTEQMAYIQELEQEEANPTSLQRLFRVDHIASRMRRTTASMLVIAGRESSQPLHHPVLVHHVVQAASCGIQHFDRVAIADLSSVAVHPSIAPDLAHLVAELLESATQSPSDFAVTVTGHTSGDGYLISIVDHGLGMSADELAAANALFVDSDVATQRVLTESQLSYLVIARLAQRYDLRVELAETAGGGVTALVLLPQIALTRIPKTPEAHPADTAPPAIEPERVELSRSAAEDAGLPRRELPAATSSPDPETEAAPTEPAITEPVMAEPVTTEPTTEPMTKEPAPTAPAAPPVLASPVAQGPVVNAPTEVVAEGDFPSFASYEGEPAMFVEPPRMPEVMADVVEEAPATLGNPEADPLPTRGPVTADADTGEVDDADLAIRWQELTNDQRAAIEWARNAPTAPTDANDATTITTNRLRPGVIDASVLAELGVEAGHRMDG